MKEDFIPKVLLGLCILVSMLIIVLGMRRIIYGPIQIVSQTDSDYSIDIEEIKKSGVGISDEKIISNKSVALKYSNMIFEKVLKKNIDKYKEVTISYDKEKEIWVFSYAKDKKTLGGDINIAIDKNTGEVLLVWSGE